MYFSTVESSVLCVHTDEVQFSVLCYVFTLMRYSTEICVMCPQ